MTEAEKALLDHVVMGRRPNMSINDQLDKEATLRRAVMEERFGEEAKQTYIDLFNREHDAAATLAEWLDYVRLPAELRASWYKEARDMREVASGAGSKEG